MDGDPPSECARTNNGKGEKKEGNIRDPVTKTEGKDETPHSNPGNGPKGAL